MKTQPVIVAGAVIAIVALAAWLLPSTDKLITTYEECVAAGYPIMESYPQQCRTPDGRTFVRTLALPYADLIQVEAPEVNAAISSPLTVTGRARGTWYFEASFPVTLVDANNKVLVQTHAQAQGEWMTTEFVPFKATVAFAPPATQTGTLIVHNDNPSGLPEHDKEVRIPVRFSPATAVAGSFAKPITLRIGESAAFPEDFRVVLKEINDSRCKPDVQCVWQGELGVVLGIDVRGRTEEVRLGTATVKSIGASGYTITLQAATETSATIVVRSEASGQSGILGSVHMGPTCPVERVPADPQCADKPFVDAVIEVRSKSTGLLVGQTTTSATGSFRLAVAAGTYTVKARPGDNGQLPSCTQVDVTVRSGGYAAVDISCDTGIR